MERRIDYSTAAPGVVKAMLGMHSYLNKSGMDEKLLNLVYLRASQINHCAYCIDMHWKDLRASGEPEQKLYMLNAWHEWPEFTARERAALAWAEAVTLLTEGFVPDEVFEAAHAQFSDEELSNLTLAVVAINGWNRLNVSLRTPAGSYQTIAKHRTA
jgi:AhpD family alkylhydroperoxidase